MRLFVKKAPDPQWKSWLDNFNGNIYHSTEWAGTRSSGSSEPLYFQWMDDIGHCKGIAVGIKSWSPVRCIGRFSKRLDFETYPAVEGNDAGLLKSMIEQLRNFAEQEGYRGIAVQSFCSNIMLPELDQLGFTTTPRMEFILDLTLPEGELWERLSTHHRRKINNSRKQALELEEASTMEAISQLRRHQKNSADRRIRRGEFLGSVDDEYYQDIGKKYFERDLGRVFMMLHGGEPVSTAFVSMYNGRALYVYGGSSEEGFSMNAPALLFWKIFSRCRELGCREFSMGGVPASASDPDSHSHGLYRFKSGFGGKQVMCLSGAADNLQTTGSLLLKIAKRGMMFRGQNPCTGSVKKRA